jgi:adenylylsulfate kinase-like enzyme
MKELYKIQVRGKVCSGKTTKAEELFDERKAQSLSTKLVDDGSVREIYRGFNPDYVTIETVEDGGPLTVTKVYKTC